MDKMLTITWNASWLDNNFSFFKVPVKAYFRFIKKKHIKGIRAATIKEENRHHKRYCCFARTAKAQKKNETLFDQLEPHRSKLYLPTMK